MFDEKKKPSYSYFDTPEGEDIIKKLWCVLKPVGCVAFGISTTDVMAYTRPKGYLQTLGRYVYVSTPFIGAAVAFVITANLAVNIRHKDDKLNWVIGAVAAGSTVGAWRRSIPLGFFATAAFTLTAIIKKHCLQEGWSLFPEQQNTAYSGLRGARYDFSLIQERPRGWAVAPPENK